MRRSGWMYPRKKIRASKRERYDNKDRVESLVRQVNEDE